MARPRVDQRDAARRRFVQLRIYGDLAIAVDERCRTEGKTRATLVEELLRRSWDIETPSVPLTPERRFQRAPLPGNNWIADPPEPEPEAPIKARARVFSPPTRQYR